MVEEVEFRVNWPPVPPVPTGYPLLDDTLGRLKIRVGDTVATRFRTDNNNENDELLVPTYEVALWIAENWWPLLFEPRKWDDWLDDPDYRARHWLGAARHGFALPNLWLCPAGDKIEIMGSAAQLRFARLGFLDDVAETAIPTPIVRTALQEFVERVLVRLGEQGEPATPLHEAWQAIGETAPEAEIYCRLIGALGLSPYEDHPEIDSLVDGLYDRFGSALVEDLCQVANQENLSSLAELTEGIAQTLKTAPTADLGALLTAELPPDQGPNAWQWGLAAARQVRRHLHIGEGDPESGQRFFTALDLDIGASLSSIGQSEQIKGGLRRQDAQMRVALLEELRPQRRFTAARAAFLAWVQDAPAAGSFFGERLVTAAVTRPQQASRAFAAELLAPAAYVRSRAANRILSDPAIQDIAQLLDAPAGAVKYQAQHAGISVVASRGWSW
jgi:hypothetical protein